MQHTTLNINLIEPNKGQIEGLPKNPRFIKDKDFKDLVKAIEQDDTFLVARDVMVVPYCDKFIIIGGEMRYRACKELKRKDVPVCILPSDTAIKKLQEYTILDNTHKGIFDMDVLKSDWQGVQLGEWGLNVSWGEDIDFDSITSNETREKSVKIERITCPECNHCFNV